MRSAFPAKLLFWLLLLTSGCIDAYDPKVLNSPQNYLVVDGFLNALGPTTIRLSRTVNLNDSGKPPAETRASVFIEAEAGPRYSLTEGVAGTYTSAALTLDPARKYRLHLTTTAGDEYVSDYTPVKITPVIDNVRWVAGDSDLQLYVNTHDDTNSTTYYRWEYEETWEFNAAYTTFLEYSNGRIRERTRPWPYTCWSSASSSAIKLGNTASLSQDIIADYNLLTISSTSSRLRVKYSLLVKQYAQTREEYTYWNNLKKNTETIGGLFDPLPSQFAGNIHCINKPENLAIGFVGAYSVAEKRIFIPRSQIPSRWFVKSGYEYCFPPDTVETKNVSATFFSGTTVPLSEVEGKGYLATSISCVDCSLSGSPIRPAFWQ